MLQKEQLADQCLELQFKSDPIIELKRAHECAVAHCVQGIRTIKSRRIRLCVLHIRSTHLDRILIWVSD